MRSLLATVVILAAGTAVLWFATLGFRTITAEGARRLTVAEQPRPVDRIVLESMTGQTLGFGDYRDRLLLVEFIYTRCPSLCLALGDAFARISEALPNHHLDDRVALLSISFDPEQDDPAALTAYGVRHGADGRHWTVARPRDRSALPALLETFGVTVIPDDFGGFEHNAAIHLVDPQGRLARIFDLAEADGLAQRLALWPRRQRMGLP